MEECSDMLSMALQRGGYSSTFMDIQVLDLRPGWSPISGGMIEKPKVLRHGFHRFSLILLDNPRKFVKHLHDLPSKSH